MSVLQPCKRKLMRCDTLTTTFGNHIYLFKVFPYQQETFLFPNPKRRKKTHKRENYSSDAPNNLPLHKNASEGKFKISFLIFLDRERSMSV